MILVQSIYVQGRSLRLAFLVNECHGSVEGVGVGDLGAPRCLCVAVVSRSAAPKGNASSSNNHLRNERTNLRLLSGIVACQRQSCRRGLRGTSPCLGKTKPHLNSWSSTLLQQIPPLAEFIASGCTSQGPWTQTALESTPTLASTGPNDLPCLPMRVFDAYPSN